jgi:hypothetical protein
MKSRAWISAIDLGTPHEDPISPQWLMNASRDRASDEAVFDEGFAARES